MIDIKKIKKDIINYGAIKLYEWTVSMVVGRESSEEDELFNAAQIKDIFKNQYDVLKLNIEMIDYETAEVVEFITKKFFKSNSIKSSNILNYSTHVDDQGVVTSLLFTLAGESISLNVSEVNVGEGGGGGASVQNVTYSELVELKAGALLVPGKLYRITDYQCTTTQKESKSAGHQFDIVVEALSESVLSENAKATLHAGDEYFAKCKLEAWELKYCLENDTSRFAWALNGQAIVNLNSALSQGRPLVRQPSFDGRNASDVYSEYQVAWGVEEDVEDDDSSDFIYSKNPTLTDGEVVYNTNNDKLEETEVVEGKGVIYFMKDEWNNECPYDFKNIQFRRYAITQCEKVPSLVIDNSGNPYGYHYGCKRLYSNGWVLDLNIASYNENDFVWVYTFALKDLATSNIYDYTVIAHLGLKNDEGDEVACYSNKIGMAVEEVITSSNGIIVLNNIALLNCYTNISDLTYADDYSYCYSNTFGNNCYSNTFWDGCCLNTFGNGCCVNTFGNGCKTNTFGNNCYFITFGNGCKSNTFGNNCYSNTFGNSCQSNTFGNKCYFITFGEHVTNNLTAVTDCRYIIIENGCSYLDITTNDVGNNFLQNIHVHLGVCGSSNDRKTLTVATRGNTFETSFKPANSVEIEVQ